MDDNNKEVSKIKINDTQYNIKDAELRHMIDILLGKSELNIEDPSSSSDQNESANN